MHKKLKKYSIRPLENIMDRCLITLVLTERCQNSCWYCNGLFNYKKNKYEDFTPDKFKRLLKFIDAQESQRVRISFMGGEPTLNKFLPNYMDRFRKKYDDLDMAITSNLRMPLSYFKNLNLEKVRFTCSLHTDHVDDIHEWMGKAYYLYMKRALHKIVLMLYRDNVDIIKETYEKYKEAFPLEILHVCPIHQFLDVIDYDKFAEEHGFDKFNAHVDSLGDASEEEIEVILEDGTNDSKNYDKYTDFFGMMCNSGFVVDTKGNVYWCYMLNDKPILNIMKEIRKVNKWHVCTSHKCRCDYEFQKYSIREYIVSNDEIRNI